MGYRPELDGIRGVAQLAIMVFHAHPFYAGYHLIGGFVALDVFFVLSGYLITTLLLQEKRRNDRIAIGNFYVRRSFRLLPTLFLGLAVGAVVVAIIGSNGGSPRSYLHSALLALSYVGNWFEPETMGVIKHTWSLAIEEQYYLVWPVVLILFLRRNRIRGAAIALLVLAAAMSIARFVEIEAGGFRGALASTLTRPDGILIGSALALVLHRAPRRFTRLLASRAVGVLSGASLLVVPLFVTLDSAYTFGQFGITALNLAAAALIGHVIVAERSGVRRLLSLQPLPTIGKWSYGMYLFHYPMIYLIHGSPTQRRGLQWVALWFVLSIVLAGLAFRFVERAAMRLRDRVLGPSGVRISRPVWRPRIPALAPAYAAAAVAAMAVVSLTAGGATSSGGSETRVAAAIATPAPPSGSGARDVDASTQVGDGSVASQALQPRRLSTAPPAFALIGPGDCAGIDQLVEAHRVERAEAARATAAPLPLSRSVLETLPIDGFTTLTEGPGVPMALEPGWRAGFARTWSGLAQVSRIEIVADEFDAARDALAYQERSARADCALVTSTFLLPNRPEVLGTSIEQQDGQVVARASFVYGSRRFVVTFERVEDASYALIASVISAQIDALD